jgi:hypothetical protein
LFRDVLFLGVSVVLPSLLSSMALRVLAALLVSFLLGTRVAWSSCFLAEGAMALSVMLSGGESYSNSRQVWSSRSLLQFSRGLRTNKNAIQALLVLSCRGRLMRRLAMELLLWRSCPMRLALAKVVACQTCTSRSRCRQRLVSVVWCLRRLLFASA